MHASPHIQPACPLVFEWHLGFEVGVLLAGEQQRFHTDFEYTLHPGDVWLNPMWEPHGWIIPASERAIPIVFRPDFLGEEMLGELAWITLFTVSPSQRPRVTDEIRAQVLALGEELYAEAQEARGKWQEAVRFDLLRLLFTLSRNWQPPTEVLRRASLRDNNLLRLVPVLKMLQGVTPERVFAAKAAAACGMSPARFHVAFKDTMGISFGQFCLRIRANSAAQLLRWTDLGVHQIALQVGFTDASHLHRTFMNLYGCTPGEYRRRFRERT